MAETDTFFPTREIKLAATRFGNREKPPVLLLHGAGQTRHAWRRAALALADAGWHAISVDARGHGDSDWSATGDYSIDELIADLRELIGQLHQPPAVVGASLGGITALLAQGESEESLITSLVLVDITPRIDRDGVERIIGFMRAHIDGFESLDAAASAVASYQPQRRASADSEGLRKNLRLRSDGRYYWHWDPRLLDHVSQLDLQALGRMERAAQRLTLPTLLVHGKMSDIVSDDTAKAFLALVPHASYVDVQNAAHMVAGDSNDRFNQSVIEFLDQLKPS